MSKTSKEMFNEMMMDDAGGFVSSMRTNSVDYKVEPHEEAYQKAMDIVEAIQEDRLDDYGDAKVSHQSIANFWNEYLSRKQFCVHSFELDATDVAVMLSLMKVSRLAYSRKHDSFVDFASYADFALQFETCD
jgi:hypothetical protein